MRVVACALNNVVIARAYNSDHQRFLIDGLFKICPEENVKLVIVDSMISHFRGEYVGRENLAGRQQKLARWLVPKMVKNGIYSSFRGSGVGKSCFL